MPSLSYTSLTRTFFSYFPIRRKFEPHLSVLAQFCFKSLMYLACYPLAAVPMMEAGAVEVVRPFISINDADLAVPAALTMVFLNGKDEVSLLQANPQLTDMLIDLFEQQLEGLHSLYKINTIVRGMRMLSISDNNKGILTGTRILSLLVQLLRRFCSNLPPVTGIPYKYGSSTFVPKIGGGGDDVLAATAAIGRLV